MKIRIIAVVSLGCFFINCSKPKVISINSEKLLENVRILSNDSMEGRFFSTPGNLKARNFIEKRFKEIGLQTYKNNSYVDAFNHTFRGKDRQEVFPIDKPGYNFENVPDTTASGANVIGFLKGQTNKTIIITAHYDHLGIRDNNIYNGADDNASGTAALFTIAEYFKEKPTKHNLIIAAVDGEEIGSIGTEIFLKNYADKENIALNVNLDMIAHSDYYPELFACGLFHYPNLRKPLSKVESEKITLLFGHDEPFNREQNDWTLSSDHKVFYKEKIPFIYFGVEDHKDYHRPTDNYATINTAFYIESVKVIIKCIENLDEYLAKD